MNRFNIGPELMSIGLNIDSPLIERGYRERPDLGSRIPETRDVLQQLEANLSYLEDLGGRLEFSLAEVRSLIKR